MRGRLLLFRGNHTESCFRYSNTGTYVYVYVVYIAQTEPALLLAAGCWLLAAGWLAPYGAVVGAVSASAARTEKGPASELKPSSPAVILNQPDSTMVQYSACRVI